MKEICIPFNEIANNEYAEVDVRVRRTGKEWHYRVECFKAEKSLDSETADEIFNGLRNYINSYNENWELIQILDTTKGSPYVHLLYREKC